MPEYKDYARSKVYVDPDLATDAVHAARVRLALELDRVCKRARTEDAICAQDVLAMLMDAYMRNWTKYYNFVPEPEEGEDAGV